MILQTFSIRHPTFDQFLRHGALFTYHVLTHPLVIPFTVGLLLGCGFIGFINQIPSQSQILSYFVSFVAIILVCKSKLPKNLVIVMMAFIFGTGLGATWACSQASQRLSPPEALFQDGYIIRGKVISRLSQQPKSTKFYFKISELCDQDNACRAIDQQVSLYWPNPTQKLHVKDRLELKAKIKRPYGLSNPGGHSAPKQSFLNNLAGHGRVKTLQVIEVNSKISMREKLADNINQIFSGSEFKGLFLALVVGEQSQILEHQWETFRNTGTSHLMAISGLHIGLVAGLLFWLFFKGWALTPWVGRIPAQSLGAIGAILGAVMYAHLAGWSIPTQRACIMVMTFMLAILFKKQIPKFQVLCLALSIVLLFDPFAVFRPGLWLSFGAVFILLVAGVLQENSSKLQKWLAPQLFIFVGMMPLTLFWFEQTSIISPLANLIAIPWMSLTVVPLALMGSILSFSKMGALLFYLSEFSFKILMVILENLATWFKPIYLYTSMPVFILSLIGGVLLMMPKGFRYKWLSILCFVPLFAPHSSHLKEGELKLHILDVGQGTAVVIELANHTVIYDFGAKNYYGFDAGKSVINPFLRRLGVKEIDLAIISHADKDHYGGFDSVKARYPIYQVMTSNTKLFAADSLCRQGDSWTRDGVYFEVLHPDDNLHIKKNNQSCVLQIQTNNRSILLTGDIEHPAEQSLLSMYGEKLKADILLVPHHGSKSSSSVKFIQAVNPEYAIITAGYNNPYHLPNAQIVSRYEQNGFTLLNSFITGAMTFTVQNDQIKPYFWRPNQKGVWSGQFISDE